MFATPLRNLLLAAALLGVPAVASAGWITITNDTKQEIVIQETAGPQNRPVRGKCVKLQPGETHKEYQLFGGTRNVLISDGNNNALTADTLTWEKADAAFSVKADGKKVVLGVVEKK
jgi:hypothetical protein